MTITALFPTEGEILDIAPANKADLLAALAELAAARLNHPAAEVLEALEARERLGSTALGRGVAMPHSRLDWLNTPFALLARLKRPIEFDARDGEPVDLVFMVLWPEAQPEGFLPALSDICRALRDQQLPKQLRKARSAAEALAMLRAADPPAPL